MGSGISKRIWHFTAKRALKAFMASLALSREVATDRGLELENGQVIGPAETLSWDDGIYRLFGTELEALTSHRALIAETGSYFFRQTGAMLLPGMLLRSMNFTL